METFNEQVCDVATVMTQIAEFARLAREFAKDIYDETNETVAVSFLILCYYYAGIIFLVKE